jgi:hypothetical protein
VTRGRPRPVDPARARIEETTRLVARALRHAIDTGSFSTDEAVGVAWTQLLRPGGPAKRLGDAERLTLRATLEKLSRALDPSQPRSILAFARSSSEAAWALVKDLRHPGAGIADAAHGNVRALATAAVWAEVAFGKNDEDTVRRAVTRALRERRKGRGLVRVDLDDNDPLRTVLDLPERGRVILPKTDVRARIAEAAQETPLGAALRLAARFSEEIVRPAIGEELWSMARPVGFNDKAETRVIVEVKSALAAHEVQLRSRELLHRLQAIPGFQQLKGVKIVIVEQKVKPVVGRR